MEPYQNEVVEAWMEPLETCEGPGDHLYRVIVTRWGLMVVSRFAGTDGEPGVAYGDSYEAMVAAKRLLEMK